MEAYMIDDKRESMHECKEEEGIRDPSVEHLELLVRNSYEERDPVRLRRRRTAYVLVDLKHPSGDSETYKTNGMHARAIQPDLVPNGGEPPKASLDQ